MDTDTTTPLPDAAPAPVPYAHIMYDFGTGEPWPVRIPDTLQLLILTERLSGALGFEPGSQVETLVVMVKSLLQPERVADFVSLMTTGAFTLEALLGIVKPLSDASRDQRATDPALERD